MKKWLFPLAYPIISIISFILSGVVGVLGKGDGTGYGGVVIVLLGLIIYCVILIPAMCILYSKRCLLGQRGRFLFALRPLAWDGAHFVRGTYCSSRNPSNRRSRRIFLASYL